jgi:hypothetical protein
MCEDPPDSTFFLSPAVTVRLGNSRGRFADTTSKSKKIIIRIRHRNYEKNLKQVEYDHVPPVHR